MKHRASVSPSKMKEGERNMIKGSENKHKDPKVNTEPYLSDPAVPACFMRFAWEPKRLEERYDNILTILYPLAR